MRRCYLDTSALRHLLVAHEATDEVRQRLTAGTIAATSQITVTELHRLGGRVPGVSVQHVDAVLAHVDLVLMTPDQARAAGVLAGRHSELGSIDAVHRQAALDFGATEFVTSDRRQAAAATDVGLAVTYLGPAT